MYVIPNVTEAGTSSDNCNVTIEEYICRVDIRTEHISKE